MLTSIQDQTVIITGASKGIGKGIAQVFAAQGARIMIGDLDAAASRKTVEELNAQGGQAACFQCDVSDEDQVRAMVAEADRVFGGVQILCANAGVYPQKKIVEMSADDWDFVMKTNLKSSFLCVKSCIPYFEKGGYGRVVLTSSITGPVTGYPGWSHYGATKAGQLGFLRTAAMELARYNTTINAVMPGNIVTEGLEGLGQGYLDTMAASIPLKRLGKVQDIGYAALFFASREAAYITGQSLIVDGGQILPESLEAIAEI